MIICTWHPNVSNLLGLINETKEWTMNIIDEIFIHYKMNVKTSISNGIWFDVLWLNICIVGEDFVTTPASLLSIWRAKPARFWFSSDVGGQEWGSKHEWGAFLADVGLRCQAQKVKILTSHVTWKPKSYRLGSPKRTISLQGSKQNPPLQFWNSNS